MIGYESKANGDEQTERVVCLARHSDYIELTRRADEVKLGNENRLTFGVLVVSLRYTETGQKLAGSTEASS